MTSINLLPGAHLKHQPCRKKITQYLCFFSSIIFLILVLIDHSIHEKTESYVKKNKKMSSEIIRLNKILIAKKSNYFSKVDKPKSSVLNLLKWITDILPQGVVLSKIERHEYLVSLSLYSQSDRYIRDFMKSLERMSGFTKINSSSNISDHAFKIAFTITPDSICSK